MMLSFINLIADIIKMYNPEVIGFSIGIGEMDTPQARFNRAFSGAIAQWVYIIDMHAIHEHQVQIVLVSAMHCKLSACISYIFDDY